MKRHGGWCACACCTASAARRVRAKMRRHALVVELVRALFLVPAEDPEHPR